LTVECAPGDNLTVHHALHLAQPGDVLIVGSSPNCEVALWGELMSISAQSKRLAGTIIDGPVRDPLEIRALGYPVFCRDINPRRAAKETYGRINIPIRIGPISISPQDFVLADANGIVSIPRARIGEAVQLASEVAHKENEIKDQILSGRTIFEIFNLEQYVVTGPQQAAKTSEG
jgi:4-hydroxy-4-methyl-2-oxoglutarate aldolase